MFYFGIPLKAKRVSANWDHVSSLLEDCLRSIFNQSDSDFRIFVACHDVPKVSFAGDPRLEFVVADFPPPIYRDEQMVDKHRKRELIACRLRALGGGYTMFLDADDLVSRRLVEFVHKDRAPHGYIIKDGYELDYARGEVRPAPRFNRLSGSCAIVKWSVDDLPEVPFRQESCFFRDMINHIHPTWEAVFAREGRPLTPLPFRGAMYVWNNSENWSQMMSRVGPRRRLLRLLKPTRKPTAEIATEFALPTAPKAPGAHKQDSPVLQKSRSRG